MYIHIGYDSDSNLLTVNLRSLSLHLILQRQLSSSLSLTRRSANLGAVSIGIIRTFNSPSIGGS